MTETDPSSEVRAEDDLGFAHQVDLPLMRVDPRPKLRGPGARVGERLRPPFDAEPEKILRQGRLLPSFEVGNRFQPIDLRALEHECVAVSLAAIGLSEHGQEF